MDYLINALFILVAVLLVTLLSYSKLLNNRVVVDFLMTHFNQSELTVVEISRLSIKEKVKYAVPLIPIAGLLYSYPINFFTNNNDTYFRKIETVDSSQREQLRYVEIVLKSGKLVDINEFDVYEY